MTLAERAHPATAGYTRLALPTPWLVGTVNVFLLEDDPLTLFDSGAGGAASLAALERGLAGLGYRVEDLERIVLTHHHLDHAGLAGTLAQRSGAELIAPCGVDVWLARYPDSITGEDRFAEALMRQHGAAADVVRATAAHHADAQTYAGPATVTRTVADGDVLHWRGRALVALHRPGHSPSDTVFLDEAHGVLVGGDHLLAPFGSQPIIAPDLDGSLPAVRPPALSWYIDALRATAALDVDVVLPGHADAFGDQRALIARRLARYDRTTARVERIVRDAGGPLSAAEVAAGFKGEVAPGVAFFAICEALGHLDRLIAAGTVVEDAPPDAVTRFSKP